MLLSYIEYSYKTGKQHFKNNIKIKSLVRFSTKYVKQTTGNNNT